MQKTAKKSAAVITVGKSDVVINVKVPVPVCVERELLRIAARDANDELSVVIRKALIALVAEDCSAEKEKEARHE